MTEEVLKDRQRIETWFQNFFRTEMQLDENILSKDEYANALKGQRHFKDEDVLITECRLDAVENGAAGEAAT